MKKKELVQVWKGDVVVANKNWKGDPCWRDIRSIPGLNKPHEVKAAYEGMIPMIELYGVPHHVIPRKFFKKLSTRAAKLYKATKLLNTSPYAEFVAFLKQEKAYNNYINNIIRGGGISEDIGDLIRDDFNWRNSPQDYSYWAELAQKWNKFQRRLKIPSIGPLFEEFLKKNNAYEAYWKNYLEQPAAVLADMFPHSDASQEMIGSAFAWNNTPQGFDFWQKLSQDWISLVNERKKNDTVTQVSTSPIPTPPTSAPPARMEELSSNEAGTESKPADEGEDKATHIPGQVAERFNDEGNSYDYE